MFAAFVTSTIIAFILLIALTIITLGATVFVKENAQLKSQVSRLKKTNDFLLRNRMTVLKDGTTDTEGLMDIAKVLQK